MNCEKCGGPLFKCEKCGNVGCESYDCKNSIGDSNGCSVCRADWTYIKEFS